MVHLEENPMWCYLDQKNNSMRQGGNILRSAEDRAKACLPKGGWDEASMLKARNCFLVADVIWQPFMFEVYDFDVLKHYEKFKKGQNGVLICCPVCNTNKHVTRNGLGYSTSDSKKVATYHGTTRHIVRFGLIYKCNNDHNIKSTNKRKKDTSVQFQSYNSDVIDSLPEVLQEKYGGGGNLTRGGYDAEFGESILTEPTPGAEFVRKVRGQYANMEYSRHLRYTRFVQLQQLQQPAAISLIWPSFGYSVKGPLSPPTVANVRSYFDHAYNSIEPFLRHCLLTQVFGEHVSHDVTFKVAMRAKQKCLVFLMSEDGKVVRGWALDSEAR